MSSANWRNSTTKQARLMTNKKGLWLFPTLVFGFILLSLIMIVYPSYTTWTETKTEIDARNEELSQLTNKRKLLEALALEGLEDKYEILERVLPSKKPVFEFLAAMDSEASKSGVILGSYTLNPGSLATGSADERKQIVADSSEVEGGMATMPVELEISGTIDQVSIFLKGLENLAPLVGLKKMNMSLGDSSEIANDLEDETVRNVSVDLDLHYALRPVKAESSLVANGFSKADEALFDLISNYNNYEIEQAEDYGTEGERENPFVY